ncbi:glycosyl hydrolase [Capsulimonas corticalis]|uniref:Glycosyl hydrolase n=1 Tax=Capsulimonas corticalis TaxID=2219043 RepID=A0A402CS09_9BACT|nr:glycoside hydrolase family 3 C-terminal domain-containing protein [Capsulimonas corticalis]BDI28239.1 glycosyl hydrolase [Capsulimonas corticalis]
MNNTTTTHIFQTPDAAIEDRVTDLLSLMTTEEKIACLGTDPSVPRLGVKGSGHIEGLHGVAMGEPGGWGGKEPLPTTTFPQAIGLGQTWDVECVRLAAEIESVEARYLFQHPEYARGGIVVRAPNADLGRDPRWGRTEECYGEDPYFNGTLAAAFVRGLQGDHPRYWRSASLMKHFLANSNENGRENSSSDFDERLFREYYSVPFRMGVEAGSRAYMAAYNSYNGIPCGVHPMLKAITVEEWGQDGIICTDGGAMKLLVTHHKAFPDEASACAAVVQAGIGQFLDDHMEPTRLAWEQGLVTEAQIDDALRGNFRVMIRLGLLDPPELVPYAQIGAAGAPAPWLSEEHKAAARRVTQKSIVLLKNEGDVLPLDKQNLASIAVIGAYSDSVLFDWYSGSPPYAVTPLQGIAEKAGAGVAVRHSDGADINAAAEMARDADVAIVIVGNHPTGDGGWAKVTKPEYGKEAVDRESLDLEEEALIREVFAANPRTIVVLVSSFPYTIRWTQENIPAIVQMTHNSQEQGGALADVLFGDYNPAGRLVQTWLQSIDQLPPMMDYDIRHGRTHLYFDGDALYPFGHGLSYTQFAYANLHLSAETIPANDGVLNISFELSNIGDRAGEEVAQLYVRHLDSRVARPRQELKGFQRIALAAGETKTVTMPLAASDLAYWNEAEHRFEVESGRVEIRIGRSSREIELESLVTIAP